MSPCPLHDRRPWIRAVNNDDSTLFFRRLFSPCYIILSAVWIRDRCSDVRYCKYRSSYVTVRSFARSLALNGLRRATAHNATRKLFPIILHRRLSRLSGTNALAATQFLTDGETSSSTDSNNLLAVITRDSRNCYSAS